MRTLSKSLLIGLLLSVACSFQSVARGSLAWGAEMGTSIDMTGTDMTSIDLNAAVGYKNSWINIVGVGAGMCMSVANSHQAIPLYAIFRTGFKARPTRVFLDLRGGVVINNLPQNSRQTSAYINPSIGFSLATGKSFHSYISLGYTYNGLKSFDSDDTVTYVDHGLSMVNMRIGVTF